MRSTPRTKKNQNLKLKKGGERGGGEGGGPVDKAKTRNTMLVGRKVGKINERQVTQRGDQATMNKRFISND